MNKKLILFFLLFSLGLCIVAKQPPKKLRFAFLTDIHLNKQNNKDRYNGLLQALEKVKKMKPDFIILGGDVIDVSGMGGKMGKNDADSLYSLYKETLDKVGIPYYPTIGNHDRYFDKENGFEEGDELFKSYFKESYYTFEKKGIRFFVINSVQWTDQKDLLVGEKQLEWFRSELANIPKSTPIVISTHVPVYSIYYPVVENKYVYTDVIYNYKELLKVFEGYNLKLVLQGHQHLYEEIFSQKVQYITGGAVCAGWWNGAFHGTEEGFLMVDVDKKEKFTWEYIDYEWTPK